MSDKNIALTFFMVFINGNTLILSDFDPLLQGLIILFSGFGADSMAVSIATKDDTRSTTPTNPPLYIPFPLPQPLTHQNPLKPTPIQAPLPWVKKTILCD